MYYFKPYREKNQVFSKKILLFGWFCCKIRKEKRFVFVQARFPARLHKNK